MLHHWTTIVVIAAVCMHAFMGCCAHHAHAMSANDQHFHESIQIGQYLTDSNHTDGCSASLDEGCHCRNAPCKHSHPCNQGACDFEVPRRAMALDLDESRTTNKHLTITTVGATNQSDHFGGHYRELYLCFLASEDNIRRHLELGILLL